MSDITTEPKYHFTDAIYSDHMDKAGSLTDMAIKHNGSWIKATLCSNGLWCVFVRGYMERGFSGVYQAIGAGIEYVDSLPPNF